MNDPRGSSWRKWDLHVHTPASIIHEYKTPHDPWERFLKELERLPPEFKVVGINDYIFVEGYKRILAEKHKGRLKNIALFLPVIELRLDRFAGTEGHLSKVNYHVIFSDEIPPETIEAQFLNALSNKYQLAPQYAGPNVTWQAIPTKQSLEDLGKMIVDNSPPEKRKDFAPPLRVGFDALTLKLDDIQKALQSHYFENKFLTAVGKTEWASINWSHRSVADKKTLINSADLVFISSPSPTAWLNTRNALRKDSVNHHLLDCSDAHYYSDSPEKDRIGKCFTWIKADTTFEGLKLAVKEFDERVFVGDEPEKIRNVRENKTKYIRSIQLCKASTSETKEVWFDDKIALNAGLIAIIGNKGSGKSAFTDTVGLLGDSKQEPYFSFLHKDKFRESKDNKARHYQATVTWESGTTVTKQLDESVSSTSVEVVKYIPQNFLEIICNETRRTEETDFDRELKAVIFSHVDIADRLGKDTLDGLVAYKSEETSHAIEILKSQLSQINKQIADLEFRSTAEYRESLQQQLQAKEKELESHDNSKPTEVPPPSVDAEKQKEISGITSKIDAVKKVQQDLANEIDAARREQNQSNLVIAAADKALSKIDNFLRQHEAFLKDISAELTTLGIPIESILTLKVDREPIQSKRQAGVITKFKTDALLRPNNVLGPAYKINQAKGQIEALQAELDEPNKRYQAYVSDLQKWSERRADLLGNPERVGTIEHYSTQLKKLEDIPAHLADLRTQRTEKAKQIYEQVAALSNYYRELYKPVSNFIQDHPIAKEKLRLTFEVSIVNTSFHEKFFDYVHQGRSGSFFGEDEGKRMLDSIFEKYDFNDWTKTRTFLDDVIDHLENDRRPGATGSVRVSDQLKKGHTLQELYDLIFSLSYLRPRYTLMLGDRELYQLTPGQRGTLLLIFYLLVDRRDIPLVIDQPEENLDNQTVYDFLVPCIREAKKRRQILIVTHNPNLAVVSDAEQIVHAFEDKKGNKRITYTSGAIENPKINKKIVDVLEGTRPAFDNRDSKYQPESG